MKNIVPMEDKDVAALMNDCYAWFKKWRGKEPGAASPQRVEYLKEINEIAAKYDRFEHSEINNDPSSPHRWDECSVKTAMPLIVWFLNVLERRVCDRGEHMG